MFYAIFYPLPVLPRRDRQADYISDNEQFVLKMASEKEKISMMQLKQERAVNMNTINKGKICSVIWQKEKYVPHLKHILWNFLPAAGTSSAA